METESQQVLERAYELVVAKLQQVMDGLTKESDNEVRMLRQLADELQIRIPDTTVSSDGEEIIQRVAQRVAWLPIAQECVVTLLRPVLQQAGRAGTSLPQKLQKQTLDVALKWGEKLAATTKLDEFARSVGLNPNDPSDVA